jgi:hypothetical protein
VTSRRSASERKRGQPQKTPNVAAKPSSSSANLISERPDAHLGAAGQTPYCNTASQTTLGDRRHDLLAVLLSVVSGLDQGPCWSSASAHAPLDPRPPLIIWDGLKAKSKLVRDYIEREDVNIQLEYLPVYAPELNPVEYLWGYLKNHEIANLCASNLHQVSDFARRRLRSMQRRSRLVSAFWAQAELAL